MNIEKPAPHLIIVSVGIISGLIGLIFLGLAGLFGFLVVKALLGGTTSDYSGLFLVLLFLLFGIPFSVISARLLLNRDDRARTQPPSTISLYLSGCFFGLLGSFVAVAAMWQHKWEILPGAGFGILFAIMIFSSAKKRRTSNIE